MKGKLIIIISVCSLLICLPLCAFADECAMDKCNKIMMHEKSWSGMSIEDMAFHKAHFILANASEIGLNDEQVEKITMVKYNAKKNLIKVNADIEAVVLDIKQLLGKAEIDSTAVNGLIDKKYSLKAKKAKDLIQACLDIKKILTSEQYKKLKDLYSKCTMNKCQIMRGEKKERMMGMQKENE